MKKIVLNENKLRRVISETVKNVLCEEFTQSLNESMIMPNTVIRVWADKKGEEFLVQGRDGQLYDVYPDEHDSYQVDNDDDEYINKIGQKVVLAFRNHNLAAKYHVYNWEGEGILIITLPYDNYNGEYDDALKNWLKGKGFSDASNVFNTYSSEIPFKYDNYSTKISDERKLQAIGNKIEITNWPEIQDGMRTMGGIDFGKNLGILFKKHFNKNVNL